MGETLTRREVEMILESLMYTRHRFERNDSYPSDDFRRERIAEVERVTAKVQVFARGLPNDA